MTIMLICAILISTILILLSYTLSHKNNYPIVYSSVNEDIESRSQYECGLEPFEEELGIETRERFYIKFYIVGILFLIFDLETLLLFPGSLLFFQSSLPSTLSLSFLKNNPQNWTSDNMIDLLKEYYSNLSPNTLNSITITNGYKIYAVLFIFIIILILGLIYEYRKNVI